MTVPDAPTVRVRDYVPSDVQACLSVFDTNVPDYFLDAERPEFRAFLDALPGPYLVIEVEGRVVACGGHAVGKERPVADLCWGMVRRELHGHGFGRLLTEARIEQAAREPGVDTIALNTSQHTEAFYQRLGFRTVEIVRDGYAEGLHRHEMRLRLTGRDQPASPEEGSA